MVIEALEGRVLFSGIPYPAPVSALASTIAAVNALPYQVLQTTDNGVTGSQTAADPTARDWVKSNQGFALFVYPDSQGHPIIGAGLNLDNTGGPTGADTLLAQSGLSYAAICSTWTATKNLWIRSGHRLSQLKTGTEAQTKAWLKFVAMNPSVSAPVITPDEADEVLTNALNAQVTKLAALIGPEFYRLDRDPQIVLIDLAFIPGGLTNAAKLVSDIQGNAAGATDYARAADDIVVSTGPAGSALSHRVLADQTLMRYGELPTVASLSPSSLTLSPGDDRQLTLTLKNSRGKTILLSAGKFRYVSADPAVVTVDSQGAMTALSGGVTEVFYSLTDDQAIDASANVFVNDGRAVMTTIAGTTTATITPPDVHSGDTINFVVTLNASNVGEDAAGGSLAITSDDSIADVITQFNRPTAISLTASRDGQTFNARITTGDTDVNALIIAEVGQLPANSFPSTVRDAFTRLAADFQTQALTALTTAEVAGSNGSLITSANLLGTQAALLANQISSIASDEVADFHFETTAPPAALPNSLRPIKPSATLPGYLAAALTAVQANTAHLLTLLRAARRTGNRVAGAAAAGNTFWVRRQQLALLHLSVASGTLFKRQAALLARCSQSLDRARLTSTVPTADVTITEQMIQSTGLPFPVVQLMQRLGADASTTNAVQNILYVQDAQTVNGSLADDLVSPTLVADLGDVAAALVGR